MSEKVTLKFGGDRCHIVVGVVGTFTSMQT